jgi:hypothetical protein
MKGSYQLDCSWYRTENGSDRVKHSTSVTTRKSHVPWSEDFNARIYSTHTVSGGIPSLSEVVSKLRMCDLKEDLNAEDAEVCAQARREAPYFVYLCENLCALCV